MAQQQIEVWENNDPLIHFYLSDPSVTNGVETEGPMNLTGATFEFFIKSDPTAIDPTAISGAAFTIVSATGGLVDLQLTAAQVGAVGRYWYRLDVIVNSHRQTKMAGRLIVRNG